MTHKIGTLDLSSDQDMAFPPYKQICPVCYGLAVVKFCSGDSVNYAIDVLLVLDTETRKFPLSFLANNTYPTIKEAVVHTLAALQTLFGGAVISDVMVIDMDTDTLIETLSIEDFVSPASGPATVH